MGIQQTLAGMGADDRPKVTEGANSGAASYSAQFTTTALGKRLDHCEDVIGKIEPGQTIHVVSAGDWSTEHMLAALADQIGPADLIFATWSVSNASLARLCGAMATGAIRSCRAIADWRVMVRNPSALTMLRANLPAADLRLTNCHAKVYLLAGDNMHVSIVSSANLTTNPRIEASVITESKEIHDFHSAWMLAELANAKPFGVV